MITLLFMLGEAGMYDPSQILKMHSDTNSNNSFPKQFS